MLVAFFLPSYQTYKKKELNKISRVWCWIFLNHIIVKEKKWTDGELLGAREKRWCGVLKNEKKGVEKKKPM